MYSELVDGWMPRYYGFDGKPISFDEWVKISMGRHGRHVGQTYIHHRGHNYVVSTVLLGLDHGFGRGRPVIFETMIFQDDDMGGLDQDRYCTLAEAKAGHRRMVRDLRRRLRGPKRKPLIHKGGKP